jgi:hypothetical protein
MTTTSVLALQPAAAARPLQAAPPPPRRTRVAPAAPRRAAQLRSSFLPPAASRAARVGRAMRCRASAETADADAELTAEERAAALEKSLADALKKEVCVSGAAAGVARPHAGGCTPC